MNGAFHATVLAGFCMMFMVTETPPAIAAQELLQIERHVWTNAVDPTTRDAEQSYKSPVRTRQMYLWVQLKGSPELLKQLRRSSDGRIWIRHLWQRYSSDEIATELDMPLDVGRKEDLTKLAYEVDALGFFRWRTWSNKESLRPGIWRVEVVHDESYDPILCSSVNGPKPCSFTIEVR